jgi:dephospho-CoA kinase
LIVADTAPLRIALTGGIASGKTAVANEFAALGVTVIDTDQIARDVVESGTPTLAALVNAFGKDILDASGHMDRRRMRERVFADPQARQQLEAITHPAIREELTRRAAAATGPYQLHVIPLLIEGGRAKTYDRILVVDCPEQTQLQRLMQRDGTDLTQARQILAAQTTRASRLAAADDVIENTSTLEQLRTRVTALHTRYLALAAERAKFPFSR